jgi:hypothetical protein
LTGNPLYPLHFEFLGIPILRGWYVRETLLLSEYHIPIEALPVLAQILLRATDPLLLPLWCLGALVVPVWAAWRGQLLPAAVAGLGFLHVALFWTVNPYQTQERFLFAGTALLLLPCVRAFERWPYLCTPVPILLGWHLVVDQVDLGVSAFPAPLAAPLRMLRIDHGTLRLLAGPSGRMILLAAICAAAVLLCRRPIQRTWRVVLVALALAIAAAAVSWRATQAWISDARLRFYPVWREGGFLTGWLRLDQASGDGSRVAYAGTNLPYYLFGVGLRNRVEYVNINGQAAYRMHDYHSWYASHGEPLARGPTPDWDRREQDEQAWLHNLKQRRIELLFIGLTNRAGGEHNIHDREGFPIEREWADRRPKTFRLLHADRFTRLYAVDTSDRPE